MTQDLRNSQRYNRFLPIGVQAIDTGTNKVVAGPYPGRVINISRHGACLLMSQISTNTFHLFHSVRDNNTLCIQLTINIQPEIMNCKILGQPVWMDVFHEGDIHAFRLGIKFTEDAENDEMLHLEQVISQR